MQTIGKQAKTAALSLRQVTTEAKNAALYAIADAIDQHADAILEANAADIADGRAAGLTPALIDRSESGKPVGRYHGRRAPCSGTS